MMATGVSVPSCKFMLSDMGGRRSFHGSFGLKYGNMKLKSSQPAFRRSARIACKSSLPNNSPFSQFKDMMTRYPVIKKIAFVATGISLFLLYNQILGSIWISESLNRDPLEWRFYQMIIAGMFMIAGRVMFSICEDSAEVKEARKETMNMLLDTASSGIKPSAAFIENVVKTIGSSADSGFPSNPDFKFAEWEKQYYLLEKINGLCHSLETINTRSKFQNIVKSNLNLQGRFVEYKGYYELEDGQYSIISEDCQDNALYFRGNLDGIRIVMDQVGRALFHLHKNGMVHGDIVAENVLICNSNIKLQSPRRLKTPYLFEELVQKDIYDLGKMAVFLAAGGEIEPFTMGQSKHLMLKIEELKVKKSPSKEELQLIQATEFVHLISLMITENLAHHISIPAMLQHPFFQSKRYS